MNTNHGQKHAYVVLGMARSGTSAIARGLKALGVDLGDHLTPSDAKWNPKGFWEDSEIVYKINGKVFKKLDFPPYGICTPSAAQQTDQQLQQVKQSAINLVKQRFATTEHWGFKDPSTVKLLAFWQAIFAELNISDHYVIALRNPLAVATSYMKLTNSEMEIGMLLWLMHIVAAINDTSGKSCIVVSYELLLNNPQEQLERIKAALAIPGLIDTAEIDTYANNFIDRDLHHHSYLYKDLHTHPAALVVPLCARVYELLMRVAADELSLTSAEFTLAWSIISEELKLMYPLYAYIDVLLKRNNLLQRELRTINKSFLWKLLSPLRKLDHALGSRRRKAREARRLVKAYG